MMLAFNHDLFIIGAGSGGVRAARLAALNDARVGVAEECRGYFTPILVRLSCEFSGI